MMTETVADRTTCWTISTKLSFRFAFILILSFVILKNNGAFPLFSLATKPILAATYQFVPWFSEHILHYHYDFKIVTNGSGDTSFDWVSLLIIVLIAAVGAIIWSIIDRKRTSYNDGYYWLTVIVRYYIAFMFINYGLIKMMHGQMPAPTLHRLMEPLGEFSPMGLAWTYFGFSKGYSFFVGLVEFLSILLLFRKTMVLGALITLATAINVMAVNYFFDVPVKMLSTALFLFAVFLLLPYLRAMYLLFFKGEAAKLVAARVPIFNSRNRRMIRDISKGILLILFGTMQFISYQASSRLLKQYMKKSPLHGIYRIDHSRAESESIPTSWRSIIFEFEGTATVRDTDYLPARESIALDTAKRTVSLNHVTFDYTRIDNGDIVLRHTQDDAIEEIWLRKVDPDKMELNKQGFRWIQEYPNNR
ncbi:hypothetical protein PQ465_15415 [Sphingobacterium oryzagri]|uniref:DoxX family protein n=1 Tax=Sphingobacterium oryzagri TaxID=3025669 RepID=A0ABY7WGF0_9SPHI|nr:hypothetical protein [Sphingobacterium sp. KACC 22765]WDF67689.1 hypothetical protein PQ465_15415 [Sphingobacterium sp. KACC 22765]